MHVDRLHRRPRRALAEIVKAGDKQHALVVTEDEEIHAVAVVAGLDIEEAAVGVGVVEGVSRALDPDFDMWKTSAVVREWIERNLGPTGALAHAVAGAGELGRLVAGFPALASRAAGLLARADELTRDGLVLSPETIRALGERNARGARLGTLALWVIALSLVALVLMLR